VDAQPAPGYHFVTTWHVGGTCEEVSDILDDATSLAHWWPSVYLAVEELDPGDRSTRIGRRITLHTKGWLPYTLRWDFVVTESRPPRGFTLEATGDFIGRGLWTLAPENGGCVVTYDWNIVVDKPLIRRFTPLFRPLFAANHRWAMARGEESLRLELLRRRARTPEERARIPEPPGPTFPHNLGRLRRRREPRAARR
jgi:hypothetical protein